MPLRSLRFQLPLLISALLIAAVGAASWSAYRVLVRTLEDDAQNHMETAGRELAGNLDQSGRRLKADGLRLASDVNLARFLSARSDASRASARRALEEVAANRSQGTGWTLWSRNAEPLLWVGDSVAAAASLSLPTGESGPDSGDSRVLLASSGGAVHLSITAVVRSGADTLGFVTERRRVSGGTQLDLVRGLIGEDARFAIGNPDGGLWTDLRQPIPGPPPDVRLDLRAEYTAADSRQWLAAATIVPSTSWRVWVEIPRQVVLQPARAVLIQILGIAALIVGTGVAGAWVLSRRITTPLAEVTDAAEGIAAGDYARRAAVHGHDEISRLASSFNSMASRVEDGTVALETQAAELEAANEELSEAVVEMEAAREAAERTATELRELLRAVTDVVLILDSDGRYVKVLETRSDALARPAEELIGRRMHEVLPRNGADAIVSAVRKSLAEQRRVELEFQLGLDGGETRWYAGTASPISQDQVFWVARDVTRQHRLEEELRQAQKMEAVGQLAGGIAHDFNNMLTAIRSFSELLLADMSQESPHHADVTEIQAAADRAAALTRQLLAFSRRQLLQPVPLDLNDVIKGLHEMLQRLLGEDVELVCRLEPALHTAVADPGQIEQIVMNLAVNARDAMPDGGRLMLQSANVTVDEEYGARAGELAPGAYIVLSVSDTGHGMDAPTLQHIFEPFFTTKGPGRGTGLGLSTVYGIVKQSGGHVTVYSEVGRGTTFRIYLPRVQEPAPAAATPHAAGSSMPRGDETVLLVEDDPSVRLVAGRILARLGYRVLEAPTPAAAEALVAAHPGVIDLVMTDLVLPGMSGRELGELLTTVEPRLRVLYMSGYTDDAVIRRGLLAPGMPFLAKPFTVEELARVVRSTFDARPAVDGTVAGAD